MKIDTRREMVIDPLERDSYAGLAAASYDLWFGDGGFEDEDYLRSAIRGAGGAALEIGCGTGRLLLPFVAEGLEVEGLDRSPEMIAICLRKARRLGLEVTIHHAAMEGFSLPRRYRTIYVPFGSLMLAGSRERAERTLARIHAHLEPGGQAILPLHLPHLADIGVEPATPGAWRLRRVGVRPEDDAIVRCHERSTFDHERQLQSVRLRFEVVRAGEVVQREESVQTLRWFTRPELAAMLRETGFVEIDACRGFTDEPATDGDAEFTFVARRADLR